MTDSGIAHESTEDLCLHRRLIKRAARAEQDLAFMGYTHALTGLTVVSFTIGIMGLVSASLSNSLTALIGSSSLSVIMLFILAHIGGVMIPDLDNTSSRAKNDLGLFGIAISGVFRFSSTLVQNVVRTKRDPEEPNPHRGLYHTIPGALIISGAVLLLTKLEQSITVSFLPSKPEVTIGWLAGMLVVFALTHLALSTLAKEYMDKMKKSVLVGELFAFIFSSSIAGALMLFVPKDLDFWWLSVAIFSGMIVHCIGDLFTRAGVPLAFPIPINGKMWWNIRLAMVKAGGDFEKNVLSKVFAGLSIVGIMLMIYSLMKM